MSRRLLMSLPLVCLALNPQESLGRTVDAFLPKTLTEETASLLKSADKVEIEWVVGPYEKARLTPGRDTGWTQISSLEVRGVGTAPSPEDARRLAELALNSDTYAHGLHKGKCRDDTTVRLRFTSTQGLRELLYLHPCDQIYFPADAAKPHANHWGYLRPAASQELRSILRRSLERHDKAAAPLK